MAKVLPNGKLSGSIGGTTYATQPNGETIARQKPAGAGEKILYSPDCARSRENYIEFGRAVKDATLIRYSLHSLIKGYELADSNLSGRVNSIASKIMRSDSVSSRGERRVERGQLEMLTNFAFRQDPAQAFDKLFQAPLQHDLEATTGQCRVQLLPCHLKRCVKGPKGATHFRLVLQVTTIQFDLKEFYTAQAESPYLSLRDPLQQPVSLTAAVECLPAGILLSAIGVVFYTKQAGENFVAVAGGVMKVLDVVKIAAGNAGNGISDQALAQADHAAKGDTVARLSGNEIETDPERNNGREAGNGVQNHPNDAGAMGDEANSSLQRGKQPLPKACTPPGNPLTFSKPMRRHCQPCVVPGWLTTGILHNEQTVDAIGEHVQEQTNGHNTGFAGDKQQEIHTDRIVAVQGMKTNTAATGIEYRHSKEVIEVYQHGEQQYYIDPEPPRTIDQQGYEYRKSKVQEVMNDGLHARQNYG